MTDLTITCPHCLGRFELTEALAAPLVQNMQQEFTLLMDQKDRAVADRERRALDHERRNREQQELMEERAAKREKEIREEFTTKARRAARAEIAVEAEEAKQIINELQEQVAAQNEKARKASEERAKLRKAERELEEKRADLQRELQEKLNAELPALRKQAAEQARHDLAQRIAEKDEKVSQMQRRIDDLQRNAQQGSQQLQGAANENVIRDKLTEAYPMDQFEKVKTGARGGACCRRSFPVGAPLWARSSGRSSRRRCSKAAG